MKLWHDRSLLEQVLLVVLLCSLVVIMGLSITVGVRNRNGWGCPVPINSDTTTASTVQSTECARPDSDHYCTTSSCIATASQLLSSRDMGMDPCDDFYQYACGGWQEDAFLEDRRRITADTFMEDRIRRKIRELLEEDTGEEMVPEHFLRARNYYAACNNWSRREDSGVKAFLSDLDLFGGFPVLTGDQWNASAFNYLDKLDQLLDRGYKTRLLVDVRVKPDPRNNSRTIIALGEGEFPQFRPDMENPQVVMVILDHMRQFVGHLCSQTGSADCVLRGPENVTQDLHEVVMIQKTMEQARKSGIYPGSSSTTQTYMKIEDLQNTVKEMDWLTLIRIHVKNGRPVELGEEILLEMPLNSLKNITKFMDYLGSTDQGRRALSNYLSWLLILESAPDLDQRSRNIFYAMRSYAENIHHVPDLWRSCLLDTNTKFRFSVAAHYIDRFEPDFAALVKPAIEDLVSKLRTKMKRVINETYWMDEASKKIAVNKIDKLYFVIAYPEGLSSETRVNGYYKKMLVGDLHFENVRNTNAFLRSRNVGKYGKTADRTDWDMLPADLLSPESTVYVIGNNSAYLPLGQIQTVFDESIPLYLNYGRLGTIISQLFSRAFDIQGGKYDVMGNERDWWKGDARDRFNFKSQCFLDVMQAYTSPYLNMSLHGQKNLLQIITDDLAVGETYKAFKLEYNAKLPERLPGMDLNQKQSFWLAYATSMCEKSRPDWLLKRVILSLETPPSIRVNGPLSNNKNFARDFDCPQGSKMNGDSPKCRVWGP